MSRTFYYKGIQLPQLRGFCAVAVEGSYAAAAKALGLSKPTVWQQVRALERELGVTLVEPGARRVELTAEGRLLLDLVQPHVSGLDSLVRLFETQRLHLQQRLLIASTPYLIAHHLPRPIHAYRTAYPNVRLLLRDDFHTDNVLRLIDQGQLDLGMVPYRPDEPRHPHLDFEDLFQLELTLLTPSRHPLAQQKRVTAADLVKHPIIMGAGYNRSALEGLLRRHQVLDGLQVVMESSSTDIIRKYVGMGLGIAALYMGHEPDAPPKGVHLRPLHDDVPPLAVALVLRKGAHQPEHVQKFCALARECLMAR